MGTLGRKAVWGAALALWVMIPAASASAASGSGKVDKLLREAGDTARPVIVRYREIAKHDDVKHRIERRKGRVIWEHRLIPAMSAIVSAADIADLAADQDVLSVSLDADVTASAGANKQRSTSSSTSTYSNDFTAAGTLKQALGLQDSSPGRA
jgi:hypothetical protein